MTRPVPLLLPLLLLLLFTPDPVAAQVGKSPRECQVERMPATVFLDVERSCWVRSRSARLGTVLVTPSTQGANIYCFLRVGSKTIREVQQSPGCQIRLPAMATDWRIKMLNKGKQGSDVIVEWVPPRNPT
jgi:hypothetical protein